MARTAFLVLAGALLAGGMYSAATRGLADAHYTSARLLLGAPGWNMPVPDADAVRQAQSSLREAVRLEPDNPHFIEQLARTRELTALEIERSDPRARSALLEAQASLRAAARMRPGSPYTWADLARIKLRLGELDFEFYGALERAGRLGPWEPAVQLALVDIGLSTWRLLPGTGREWVIGAFDRALKNETVAVRHIAAGRGTLPLVCNSPQLPRRLAAFCVKK